MVFQETINGRSLKTGDILFTRDGPNSIYSMGCAVVGERVAGEADHCLLYVGPAGLCVEAGIHGVIVFKTGGSWNSEQMFLTRGLVDTFHAATSVLAGRGLTTAQENAVRIFVRGYVLGCVKKPCNLDLFDPDKEKAIYSSQLVYLAYGNAGIDLHGVSTVLSGRRSGRVILPRDILANTVPIPER